MIGLFGGTFDPIHLGHLGVAEYVRQSLSLDEIRFVPAGTPYHRNHVVTSAAHRLAMLEHAIRGYNRFSVDRRELDRAGPTYTIDTLRELRAEEGDRPLFLLLGVDAYSKISQWHEAAAIPALARIVVMRRPGHALSGEGGNPMDGGVVLVDVPQIPVSATLIRERCASRDTIEGLVPEAVAEYIERHQLYKGVM